MTPSLFRVATVPAVGATVVLDGAEGRHAGNALRVRPGRRSASVTVGAWLPSVW
ncbi:hypothetical protein ACFSSF_10115 [Dietzia aerolata]|uniref:hypothetical protein n=1 Tax=Dietzia aerolata TaxID=595984 RepID=UPI00364246AD